MLSSAVILSFPPLPSHSRDSESVRDFLGVTKPFFSPDTVQVVEVREGVTAYLPCQVYNRNNFSVSWIRNVLHPNRTNQPTNSTNFYAEYNFTKSFILDIFNILYFKDKSSVLNTLLDLETVTS